MKKVLIIAPYQQVYPPTNGGMLRTFFLMKELNRFYEVHFLSYESLAQWQNAIDKYPELIRVKFHEIPAQNQIPFIFKFFPPKWANRFTYRFLKGLKSGPADGHFLKYWQVLKKILIAIKPEVIIYENTSCLKTSSFIKRFLPSAKILLNAHNVDSDLASEALLEGRISEEEYGLILQLESELWQETDGFFACSEKDKKRLLKLNEKSVAASVVPNGVDTESKELHTPESPSTILFCGTVDYLPNLDGINWFLRNCWTSIKNRVPEASLCIVGSGDPTGLKLVLNEFKGQSIDFFGKVPDLDPFYRKAGMVIIPLHHGSGTRLKVLEALAYGKIVISTQKGAEGINYVAGQHLIESNEAVDFANQCISVLTRPKDYEILSKAGQDLVKSAYDWKICGKKLNDFIHQILSS